MDILSTVLISVICMCVCERERKRKSAAAAVAAHSFHGNVETHLGLYGNFLLAPTEIERKKEVKM